MQDTADTAIGSVNKTASDAVESISKAEESISKSVTDARASADAAANSEQQAAASVTAAQNAVNGFGLQAGTTTTGKPGTDAAVEIQKTGTKYTANFTIPRGEKGADGASGKDGTGVTILGSYSSIDALKAEHPTGSAGDSCLVNGHLYVWDTVGSDWKDVGTIQGPKGEPGVGGTENVLVGTGSGTVAAADDSYSAPRQIRVHGDATVARPEKLIVKTNNNNNDFFPNIPGKPQNGITLTQDANGVYHMNGVSTITGRIM